MFYSKFVLFVAIFAVSCGLVFAQKDTGGIKGFVRTTQNLAIPEVSVTARQNGKDIKTAITDRTGAFELNGLENGSYNIFFDKNGYNPAILYNVEIKKNKTRDLGNKLILKPDDGSLVIIRGIVFDQNGRSVRGANIEIEKKQGDGSYKQVKTTTSSYGVEPLATGEFVFRFTHDKTADFRITASSKGVSASKEINVVNAAVYRLALTLNIPNEKEDK